MTRFHATADELAAAAAWAERATPRRPTIPVLAGLLLETADDNGTHVSGYDFETLARVTIGAGVERPGRVVVSAQLLAAITRSLPRTDTVTVDVDGGTATVRAGRAEWTLPTLPLDEYPQLPEPPAPAGVVDAEVLRSALGKVLPALPKVAELPILGAVHLESDGPELTIVATDRYRLAAATIPWTPAGDEPLDATVPGAMFDTALRGLVGDTITVHLDHRGFALSTPTRRVAGRAMAERYVPWAKVMPEPTGHYATVDVAELAAAVRQANIGATAGVILRFTPGEVTVAGDSADTRGRASASCELVGESPMFVKVNPNYLLDAIMAPGDAQVTIGFGEHQNRPLLVTGEDPGYRHAVTPIRFNADEIAAVAAA